MGTERYDAFARRNPFQRMMDLEQQQQHQASRMLNARANHPQQPPPPPGQYSRQQHPHSHSRPSPSPSRAITPNSGSSTPSSGPPRDMPRGTSNPRIYIPTNTPPADGDDASDASSICHSPGWKSADARKETKLQHDLKEKAKREKQRQEQAAKQQHDPSSPRKRLTKLPPSDFKYDRSNSAPVIPTIERLPGIRLDLPSHRPSSNEMPNPNTANRLPSHVQTVPTVRRWNPSSAPVDSTTTDQKFIGGLRLRQADVQAAERKAREQVLAQAREPHLRPEAGPPLQQDPSDQQYANFREERQGSNDSGPLLLDDYDFPSTPGMKTTFGFPADIPVPDRTDTQNPLLNAPSLSERVSPDHPDIQITSSKLSDSPTSLASPEKPRSRAARPTRVADSPPVSYRDPAGKRDLSPSIDQQKSLANDPYLRTQDEPAAESKQAPPADSKSSPKARPRSRSWATKEFVGRKRDSAGSAKSRPSSRDSDVSYASSEGDNYHSFLLSSFATLRLPSRRKDMATMLGERPKTSSGHSAKPVTPKTAKGHFMGFGKPKPAFAQSDSAFGPGSPTTKVFSFNDRPTAKGVQLQTKTSIPKLKARRKDSKAEKILGAPVTSLVSADRPPSGETVRKSTSDNPRKSAASEHTSIPSIASRSQHASSSTMSSKVFHRMSRSMSTAESSLLSRLTSDLSLHSHPIPPKTENPFENGLNQWDKKIKEDMLAALQADSRKPSIVSQEEDPRTESVAAKAEESRKASIASKEESRKASIASKEAFQKANMASLPESLRDQRELDSPFEDSKMSFNSPRSRTRTSSEDQEAQSPKSQANVGSPFQRTDMPTPVNKHIINESVSSSSSLQQSIANSEDFTVRPASNREVANIIGDDLLRRPSITRSASTPVLYQKTMAKKTRHRPQPLNLHPKKPKQEFLDRPAKPFGNIGRNALPNSPLPPMQNTEVPPMPNLNSPSASHPHSPVVGSPLQAPPLSHTVEEITPPTSSKTRFPALHTVTPMANIEPIAKVLVQCCSCRYLHDLPSKVYECMTRPDNLVEDRELGISGLIATAVKCPWCGHGMMTSCCAGYAAVVHLQERLH